MKRIVSLQDISCLGKCSLTVALPVISAMGVECAILPTAVLSTHTMFDGFTCKDLTDQIMPIANHWNRMDIHFDAIYTGYLASAQQADVVCAFFQKFKREDNLIFVDPAMADHGVLYKCFDQDFVGQMAKVCRKADMIVPNLTEAALLTGRPYASSYTETGARELLADLAELGPRTSIVTGVSFTDGTLGTMAYDAKENQYVSYFTERLPYSYHGTGDLFASSCIGGLMNGLSLEDAMKLSADFVVSAMIHTANSQNASWYGVEFEPLLPQLMKKACGHF